MRSNYQPCEVMPISQPVVGPSPVLEQLPTGQQGAVLSTLFASDITSGAAPWK